MLGWFGVLIMFPVCSGLGTDALVVYVFVVCDL